KASAALFSISTTKARDRSKVVSPMPFRSLFSLLTWRSCNNVSEVAHLKTKRLCNDDSQQLARKSPTTACLIMCLLMMCSKWQPLNLCRSSEQKNADDSERRA